MFNTAAAFTPRLTLHLPLGVNCPKVINELCDVLPTEEVERLMLGVVEECVLSLSSRGEYADITGFAQDEWCYVYTFHKRGRRYPLEVWSLIVDGLIPFICERINTDLPYSAKNWIIDTKPQKGFNYVITCYEAVELPHL